MAFWSVLIANRGEIAVRIARACADEGLRSVAVFASDDQVSGHIWSCDDAAALSASGVRAYLDTEALIALAQKYGCEAIHPGYGFLSENAAFARACEAAGLVFIGPRPQTLALFGDKAAARALAAEIGAPVLAGSDDADAADAAAAFLKSLPAGRGVMIKARAGGGGRGMQPVFRAEDLPSALQRCAAEAAAAFGDGALYLEEFLPRARHLEVQLVADAHGGIRHLGERECTIQRRRQKLIEYTPAIGLPKNTIERACESAVALGRAAGLQSLATIEFLVDADDHQRLAFIEANPRIQVEHTVTEEAWGVDLVRAQLALAAGASLADLDVGRVRAPRAAAVQARVCAETLSAQGEAQPSAGLIAAFDPPGGPGVRVDTAAHAGDVVSPNYDSLLAKVIASGASAQDAARKTERALRGFGVEGVDTNMDLLRAILLHDDFQTGRATTTWVEDNAPALTQADVPQRRRARRGAVPDAAKQAVQAPPGCAAAPAPLTGTVVEILARAGEAIGKGAPAIILEAMKMQHVVAAPESGMVHSLAASVGETVSQGAPLYFFAPSDHDHSDVGDAEAIDLDRPRVDLEEAMNAVRMGLDEARPSAVARRRKTNQRTARENIADLVDPGSFIEYGALAVAAQRRRRSLDDLIANTPGDGMVTGIGAVNGAWFSPERARTAVLSYDYTVLAGTQGYFNHRKTDRLLLLAQDQKLPVVFFAEGGGGRPGDTDVPGVAGLDTPSFHAFAHLSGLAPRIAIASGRCFAGNAAFFGCADITIATRNSNIGMGGPAMIEGGGLGVYAPEDVGPVEVQARNGVLDLVVDDEAEAVARTKTLLSYFQGARTDWTCGDQRALRWAIPENRLRVYDVRAAISGIFDTGSFLELRAGYGAGVITGFGRVEGHPFGVVANNPAHLGGALDAEASEKAARFLQLCNAFDIPVVSLIDTPGFMVGPDAEKEAGVRRMSSLFVVGANISVPVFAIVLRKCYGLGAQAMAAGSTLSPFFIASWPTGEFGGMGLEGAVKLGYRKELEAETDPAARAALYNKLVANMYERGKAVSMARALEIDAVIDPADTRTWILRGLKSVAPPRPREGKKAPFIDTW
ncbi:MAG: carbamoyl-phosphate synthase large subunit [Alphaproteobacteria bacterium]|nr:carbamoyl-phosphate synthase large subunit [Alphaproteobacteria bacterium]